MPLQALLTLPRVRLRAPRFSTVTQAPACATFSDRRLHQDSIYDAYRHLLKDEPRKPLKALRKTGASLLDTHDVYVHCVEHYLAHAAHTVTDRSYRNYSQERFNAAIKWLGSQFGL